MTASASSRSRLAPGRPSRNQAIIGGSWLVALAVAGYLSYRGAIGPMRDLEVYRDGALAMRQGRNLYSMVTSTGLPYTYPPIGAILATPLTLVPFSVAKFAWDGMVCVPLIVAIWFGFRPLLARVGRAAPAVLASLLAGCILLVCVREEFYFGQVDLFLVAICLLDCRVRHPRWPRGLLIGLATAIKLEPGAFIIYLLITRRRKDAAVAALSFAAWTGIAWLFDPHDSVTYWTSAIFQTNRLGGNGSAANQSLRGIILRVFKPHLAPAYIWLAVALVVAVAGFAAARSCWRRGNDMAGLAITGLLSAALSPVAWIHHYCWLVVTLGVIVGDGRSRRRVATAAVAWILFLTALPIWAQTMMRTGKLGIFPGRELEAAFGLAALVLIAIMYRIRATHDELRARDLPSGWERGRKEKLTRPAPSGPAESSGVEAPEQLPSGSG
jgi:alpha-1,2-mannosyltransferase